MSKRDRQIADAVTTADLWKMMMERVPPIVSEYFRGGADHETSLRGNVKAFQQSMTTAYGAIKFDAVDMSTTVLGHKVELPWYVSPVGSLRSLWPKGDAVAAQVAGEFGTVMAQSTLSGTRLEDVASASPGPCWYQLYLCGGRETAERTIARAREAGFAGLILTMDTGVSGLRVQHARMKPMQVMGPYRGLPLTGMVAKAFRKLGVAPQMLPRLSWLMSHYRDGGLMEFVNIIDNDGQPMPYTDIGTQLAASAVTWDDLKWIRAAWGDKPLIIKGVHCAYDARKAEELGASAVMWSNHGGRQQDRVPPVLQIVAEEMPKVGESQLDFMMDGGIRNGTDILIALTYGLKAVGIGRVTAAGIGAGGHAGLTRAFEILKTDLDRAMRLVGVQSVEEIRSRGEELRRESMLRGDDHLPRFEF